MTPVSERRLLPTKPLLILRWLLSKSQRQSRARSHTPGCGLSPFPHGLSANAPAATGELRARGRGAQPSSSHRTARRDTGGTQGLLGSFAHLAGQWALPVCKVSPLLKLSGVQTPPNSLSLLRGSQQSWARHPNQGQQHGGVRPLCTLSCPVH